MLINYDLKAIFFHNPKCGGNSVIDILRNYDFLEICRDDHENYIDFVGDERYINKHIKDKHTIRKMGKYRYFYSHQNANKTHMDEFFKFTFVRNPYTKLLSAYMYLKRRIENDNNTIRGLEENPEYFTDFNVFVKNYQAVNNISFFHTFIPQYEQLVDFSNNIHYQYIGKTETLNEDLINIFMLLNITDVDNLIRGIHTKHNVTIYDKNITEYYNEETFKFVNTFFEKDFEVLGYKKYNTFEEFQTHFCKDSQINYNDDVNKIHEKTILVDNQSTQINYAPDYFIKIPSFIKKKFKINNNQQIPKIIMQTFKNNYLHPMVYENIMKMIKKNPTYDYYFINDEDGIKLIEEHFDEKTLSAFKKLKVGAAKGDFIRYVALYVYGGVYIDLDASININLDDFIPENNEYIFFWEGNKEQITNWCVMIIPKHIIIKKIIDEMVNRILNSNENNILLITGPKLMTDVIYNHFTNSTIYNSYDNLIDGTIRKFIENNNHPVKYFETFTLCCKLKLFSFRFDNYDEKMIYYNEIKYDYINNFNIYSKNIIINNKNNIKNTVNIKSSIIDLFYFLYINKHIHSIINKYIQIIDILLNENNQYRTNKTKNIKNEIKKFELSYLKKKNINNEILSKLTNYICECKKQNLFNNINHCDKCKLYKYYNENAYNSHKYFCK